MGVKECSPPTESRSRLRFPLDAEEGGGFELGGREEEEERGEGPPAREEAQRIANKEEQCKSVGAYGVKGGTNGRGWGAEESSRMGRRASEEEGLA